MSIKSAMLKALGFSSTDDDDYEDISDLPSGLPVNHQGTRGEIRAAAVADYSPEVKTNDNATVSDFEFPLEAFDSLLKVFNDAQPDFIKNCIDIQSQRQYLYNSLNESFKTYFDSYCAKLKEIVTRQNEGTLRKIDSESSALRQELDSMRKNLSESREQNMSAVRQRRAFNERIRDLEQQLETEKAEKDQYALETKSLLNKLKVAQIQGASDEESAAEISRLRESLDKARTQFTEATSEIQDLNRRLDESRSALDVALAENRKLKDDLDAAAGSQPVNPPLVIFDKTENTSQPVAEVPADDDPATPARKPRRHHKKPKKPQTSISAIDDTLDTTEWLIPTPPEGQAKSMSSVTDSDFGYHEPQREDPLVNDAQLSLFD